MTISVIATKMTSNQKMLVQKLVSNIILYNTLYLHHNAQE